MGLSIKLTNTAGALAESPSGELISQGVSVTRDGGCLDVRTLASALALGAPVVVPVRLRVDADVAGCLTIQVREVFVGGRWQASPGDVEAPWADFWRASLADAVRAEIERAMHAARRGTRRARAVATPSGSGESGAD